MNNIKEYYDVKDLGNKVFAITNITDSSIINNLLSKINV